MPKAEAQYILTADDRTEKAFRSVQTNFKAAAKAATRFGVATTAALAGIGAAAFASTARDVLRFGDSVVGLSRRLGISQGSLLEYRQILERFGVPFQTFATSLQRMQRRLSEATLNPKSGPAKAIEELGLNVDKLNKMPLDKAFEKVATALQKVKLNGDKTRLAMQLFDTEGVQLLQMINEVGGSLGKLREEQRLLGNTVDKEGSDALERYREAWQAIKDVWRGFVTQAVQNNIGKITDIVVALGQKLPDIIEGFEAFGEAIAAVIPPALAIAKIIGAVFGGVSSFVSGVTEFALGAAAMGKAALGGNFGKAKSIGDKLAERTFGGTEGFMTGGPSTLAENFNDLFPKQMQQESTERTMLIRKMVNHGVVGVAG